MHQTHDAKETAKFEDKNDSYSCQVYESELSGVRTFWAPNFGVSGLERLGWNFWARTFGFEVFELFG